MEFWENNSKFCDRSVFANRVLKLVYEKHNGDLDKARLEIGEFYEHFKEWVDNIYELIGDEIPMFEWYELVKYSKEGFALEENEWYEQIEKAKNDCLLYYGKPKVKKGFEDLKIGDLVTVVKRICGHEFEIGEVVSLVKKEYCDLLRFSNGKASWCLSDEEISIHQ